MVHRTTVVLLASLVSGCVSQTEPSQPETVAEEPEHELEPEGFDETSVLASDICEAMDGSPPDIGRAIMEGRIAGIAATGVEEEPLRDALEQECGDLVAAIADEPTPEPGSYGSNSTLDGMYDRCGDGDMSTCEFLFRSAPTGSEYQTFAEEQLRILEEEMPDPKADVRGRCSDSLNSDLRSNEEGRYKFLASVEITNSGNVPIEVEAYAVFDVLGAEPTRLAETIVIPVDESPTIHFDESVGRSQWSRHHDAGGSCEIGAEIIGIVSD